MRLLTLLTAAVSVCALAACDPIVPDSAEGVGIDGDPFAARPAPGTTINGDPLVPPAQVSTVPLPGGTSVQNEEANWNASTSRAPRSPAQSTTASSDDIVRQTAAALGGSAGRSASAAGLVHASPSNPAPQVINNPGISDENDFGAVSARQSIESDAERLRRQRDQFQQVAPSALPSRGADSGPNIVKYALSTRHSVGQRMYSRAGVNLRNRAARNCAAFTTADEAQIAFLSAGGPNRDRKVLDPDGDGFACNWDPRPYRLAVGN